MVSSASSQSHASGAQSSFSLVQTRPWLPVFSIPPFLLPPPCLLLSSPPAPCPLFLSPEPDAELAHLTPAHIPSATSGWGLLPAGLAALLLLEGWPGSPAVERGLLAGRGWGRFCLLLQLSSGVPRAGRGSPPRWRGIFYTSSFESQAQCGSDRGLNGERVLWLSQNSPRALHPVLAAPLACARFTAEPWCRGQLWARSRHWVSVEGACGTTAASSPAVSSLPGSSPRDSNRGGLLLRPGAPWAPEPASAVTPWPARRSAGWLDE